MKGQVFSWRGKFVLYIHFILGLLLGDTNKGTSQEPLRSCLSATYIFHEEMGKRPVDFVEYVTQCSEGRHWCFLTQIQLEVWAKIYCKVPFLIIRLVSSVTFTYQMFFTLHDLFTWSHAYAISEYKHMYNKKTLVWHYFLLLQSVRNGQTCPPTHAQELVRSSVKYQRGFPILSHDRGGSYSLADSPFVEIAAKSTSSLRVLLQNFFCCTNWKINCMSLYISGVLFNFMGQHSRTPGCGSSSLQCCCLVTCQQQKLLTSFSFRPGISYQLLWA